MIKKISSVSGHDSTSLKSRKEGERFGGAPAPQVSKFEFHVKFKRYLFVAIWTIYIPRVLPNS